MVMKYCDRPEYAPDSSDEEEEEEVEFKLTKQQQVKVAADVDNDMKVDAVRDDRRLRRLQDRQQEDVDSDEDREARFGALCLHVLLANEHLLLVPRYSLVLYGLSARSCNDDLNPGLGVIP